MDKLGKSGLQILWDIIVSALQKNKTDLQNSINEVDKNAVKKALVSGEQTTSSTESGGKNVYTFTDSDGDATELVVYNGAKGDTGATGAKGADGAKGATGATGTRGSQMYWGTAITGTSTTATIFSSSGVSSALVNDMYLNTSTWNVYQCTVAGAASAAKWVYKGNIKGATGSSASVTKANVVSALGHTPPSYLLFTNVSVAASAWKTYTASLAQESNIVGDYPYKADITLSGVTADHAVRVNLGAAEVADGVFAQYVNSQSGKIRIYANAKPTVAITIPTITAIKKEA